MKKKKNIFFVDEIPASFDINPKPRGIRKQNIINDKVFPSKVFEF